MKFAAINPHVVRVLKFHKLSFDTIRSAQKWQPIRTEKCHSQGDQPGRKVGIVEHDYATAAETFTLSRSATDISNDGGSSRCWCLHFVQVTASVILKTACW